MLYLIENCNMNISMLLIYAWQLTIDICKMFGSDIIPEEGSIGTAYFCHTVTGKKYP